MAADNTGFVDEAPVWLSGSQLKRAHLLDRMVSRAIAHRTEPLDLLRDVAALDLEALSDSVAELKEIDKRFAAVPDREFRARSVHEHGQAGGWQKAMSIWTWPVFCTSVAE